MVGTIEERWGNPDYIALDVLLDDGRSELFWHHELEEITQRFSRRKEAHRTVGVVRSGGEELATRSERLDEALWARSWLVTGEKST
jgi:hypothetical protein